jgi:hypothetical protein
LLEHATRDLIPREETRLEMEDAQMELPSPYAAAKPLRPRTRTHALVVAKGRLKRCSSLERLG